MRSVISVSDDEVLATSGAPTIGAALRRLGVAPNGTNYIWFHRRCAALGMEIGGDRPPLHPEITHEQLLAAASEATSKGQVLDRLNLRRTGTNYSWLRAQIEAKNIEAPASEPDNARTRVSDEAFRASLSCLNIRDALRFLALSADTSTYRWYRERCADLGVNPPARGRASAYKYSDDEVFVAECQVPVTGTQLKTRLLRRGWANRCMNPLCPDPDPIWAGAPLTLQLDHVNGDSRDNRVENLRILCPNCHSQTPTFCGRKVQPKPSETPSLICPSCEGPMWRGSSACKECCPPGFNLTPAVPKIEWPALEALLEMLQTTSVEQVGRTLGVSGNAVRKHLRTRHGMLVDRTGVRAA